MTSTWHPSQKSLTLEEKRWVIILQPRRDSSTDTDTRLTQKKISPRSPEIVFDLTLVPKLQHNGRLGSRAIFRTKFSKSSKQLSGNFLKGGFLKRCHFNKMFQRERESLRSSSKLGTFRKWKHSVQTEISFRFKSWYCCVCLFLLHDAMSNKPGENHVIHHMSLLQLCWSCWNRK